jgi:hypothetical protein
LRRRFDREFTAFSLPPLRRRRRWTNTARLHRNRESLLIARYRFICALANSHNALDRKSEFLARQDNTIRREEMSRLEKRVGRWSGVYQDRLTREPLHQDTLFPLIAWLEADDLVRDYAWWQGRRTPGRPVSQTALRLLRIWTLAHLDRSDVPRVPHLDECRRRVRWPSGTSSRDIMDIVRHELTRTPDRWRTFQEY